MLKGKLYTAKDEELDKLNKRKNDLVFQYNHTNPNEVETLQYLLRKLLGECGKTAWITPPFYCDYGCHIRIGNHFYANMDCIFLDVAEISIGDNVYIGPRVSLYTAGHPIDKDIRNEDLEYGYPIKIGNDVWIGGGTVVNPGITIGNNVVIGSGSVVTKDVPSNCVAAGNPCKVIRKITLLDKAYWERQKEEANS